MCVILAYIYIYISPAPADVESDLMTELMVSPSVSLAEVSHRMLSELEAAYSWEPQAASWPTSAGPRSWWRSAHVAKAVAVLLGFLWGLEMAGQCWPFGARTRLERQIDYLAIGLLACPTLCDDMLRLAV